MKDNIMTSTVKFYYNGPILTMDSANNQVEAIITTGGIISAVGDYNELLLNLPNDVEHIDLKGKTLMPAFIDPHGHFPDPGFIKLFRVNLAAHPLGDCNNLDTAFLRLGEKCKNTPKGQWVMGAMFDNTAVEEKRMPTRNELDAISTEHPIWVMHSSGHNGVANSLALAEYNITDDTPNPLGGRYVRDPSTGELTGLIEGISAMGEMGDTDFLIDRKKFKQGFNVCRDEYLHYGVTMAQNAWASKDMLDHFASVAQDGDPGIDIVVLPIGELEPELSNGSDALNWPDNSHIKIGPRKLFSDGSFQLKTAYLSEPYYNPNNVNAENFGVPYNAPEVLTAKVKKLHEMGFQIHCHANGDAGADLFLDAVEAALNTHPRNDHRHTIIHGQALRDDQLQRMAKMGVTVSFFPAHIYFWGDRHYDTFLGPKRAERISPAKSAEKYGVRYTIHNDASVTPTRPIHLAHCAINRLTLAGRVLGEQQKVSVLSALRAQTIDAAWQVFQEDKRGSLEKGKLADMIVLSGNPLLCSEKIDKLKVLKTIRRGNVV
jgi:predicted amidohydrolase YtcJ